MGVLGRHMGTIALVQEKRGEWRADHPEQMASFFANDDAWL